MGITEILRRIWLFSANKIKSAESISKQPTQLTVQLNSSLLHIIVTMVFSILPKNERNSLLILSKEEAQDSEFRSFLGRIEDTINCFCDLLNFGCWTKLLTGQDLSTLASSKIPPSPKMILTSISPVRSSYWKPNSQQYQCKRYQVGLLLLLLIIWI